MRAFLSILQYAVAATFLLTACSPANRIVKGSKVIVERSQEMPSFTKVEINTVGRVTVALGDSPSVVVRGDDNLMRYIVTEVTDGVLRISEIDGYTLQSSEPIEFLVTAKKIEGLLLEGSGTIGSKEQLVIGDLRLELKGAGDLLLDIYGNSVLTTLSGSGKVVLRGDVRKQKVFLSGAGSYEAFEMDSKDADVNVSGAGNVMVTATDSLDADISGVGSIIYKGVPTITERITGMGTLRHHKQE